MRHSTPLFGISAILLLSACSDDAEPESALLDPPPAEEGFQLAMTTQAAPGEEVWNCAVYDMPITRAAAVNWVEYAQTPGMHHFTLSTLGLMPTDDLLPGTYDCNELYGDSSLMENQIMFFGGQGDATGVMNLPTGTAANFPGRLRVIHELHYVNVTDQPVNLESYINAYTIPQSEVTESIFGVQVRDENIVIPPRETHSEWSRCVFNEDVNVIFLASHMHELGIGFTIAPFDGTETGEVIYSNNDWHIPNIVQYDPPLEIQAGTGFEWTCTWENPGDETVTYGSTAEDEMCNPAMVFAPFSLTADCEVVETSDGVLWARD